MPTWIGPLPTEWEATVYFHGPERRLPGRPAGHYWLELAEFPEWPGTCPFCEGHLPRLYAEQWWKDRTTRSASGR